MLESLKDLYISYPFLPVADAPDFFSHIKDIRVVYQLPATDLLLGYKNNRNGNYVRAWLTALEPADGDIDAYAEIKIQCSQVQEELFTVRVPFVVWTEPEIEDIPVDYLGKLLPTTQNWLLCDQELIDGLADIPDFEPYELNPDVLLLMQKAPALYKGVAKLGNALVVGKGYNTTVSLSDGQIAFYGASGIGSGTYKVNQPFSLSAAKQAAGLNSINGLTGDIRIAGTFPVRTDSVTVSGGTMTLNITVEDSTHDQD